jgi:rhodanese-related sulfurtransferase
VIFTQFVDDDLGCASYLVGDESTGSAAVVDPALAIEQYLEEADRRHVRIERVVETHTHADHVSGHGRFALEHHLPVTIQTAAEAQYPHDAMEDGHEIELGDVVLRCIHTPGHRPEHCGLAVIDRSRGPDPWLVLTGDSLFVGATDENEAAHAIRGLRSVGIFDIQGYVLGGGPETLELVTLEELDELLASGAQLIDVREKDERDDGYIANSRNIPYRMLALGESDLPRDRPLVTICESGPRAAIAASVLAARGFDARAVADGGIDDWQASGRPVVEFRRCGS